MEGDGAAQEARRRATADIESAISDVFRAGRTWTRDFARRFEPPLPAIAFGVLRYVRVNGPVRAGDIAVAFDMDKATVSRQLALLREHGLIEQTPDPLDRRATLVVVSATALAAFDALRADIRARYEANLADWDTADLERFADLLTRFMRSLR